MNELETGNPVAGVRTVVLELDGVQWASQKNVVETVLGRRPGVVGAEANPVAQTVTVRYDPARITVEHLAGGFERADITAAVNPSRITCVPYRRQPPTRTGRPAPPMKLPTTRATSPRRQRRNGCGNGSDGDAGRGDGARRAR